MAIQHDIVRSDKMAMESVKSLTNVECEASTDLDNGRLVVVENGKVRYAKAGEEGVARLHHSVEKMYDESLGLAYFYVEKGEMVRHSEMLKNDEFSTTAIKGECAVGDILKCDANGEFTKDTVKDTGRWEVIDFVNLGFTSISFGITSKKGARLRVIK